MNEYRLSDEVIAQIARVIQVAILTGTDVVDNLRTLRVTVSTEDDNTLSLTEDYKKMNDSQIEKMLEKAAQESESTSSEEALEVEGDLN